jgi:hypothetical protein
MDIQSDKITVRDLLRLKTGGMLHVNPEYQRGAVRKEPQQKRLIDSVMRGYPLPLIYLHYKTIQKRHLFFARKMADELQLRPLDPARIFGELEREIVYLRSEKKCAVCDDLCDPDALEIQLRQTEGDKLLEELDDVPAK